MDITHFFRFVLISWLATSCWAHAEKPTKYPPKVHQMIRERLSKSRMVKMEGVWSSWSPWTPCSRTCGGGVTMQSRECISRPADSRMGRGRRRKRLETNEVTNHCVGLYKRYHLCNTQECENRQDFRAEQCASFNGNPFRGRVYYWEPFIKAGDECALNCRAVGMGFYATLNKTVKDGTPCANPVTSMLVAAPPGTKGVCVAGMCKSVSKEGVIGAVSASRQTELCAACSAGCQTISGLFTQPQLPPGASLVTQVPRSACRLTISQLKHTHNHIAIRYSNGTYILNGEHVVGKHREVEAAGTRFTYRRQDASNVESVSAPGALETPIEIVLIYKQPNPGIKYEYMLPANQALELAPPSIEMKRPASGSLLGSSVGTPRESPAEPRRLDRPFVMLSQGDEARPTRRRRRKFLWKVVGTTPCTKSCGGGVNHLRIICVREHNHSPVIERRCVHLERPRNHTIRCNTQPCPVHWSGTWSTCSATCGPGQQTRVLTCQQEVGPSLVVNVKETLCLDPRPPTVQKCEISPCDPRENELEQEVSTFVPWTTGVWSKCSVTCGNGQRTRLVSCTGRCRPEERPHHTEHCRGPPCDSQPNPVISTAGTQSHSGHSHSSDKSSPAGLSAWLTTEWTEHCSVECGTGTQSRWIACPTGECDHSSRPDTTRACSSDKQCGGKWYTGPWGSCSDSCNGSAKQKREVVCIVHVRGHPRLVSDMTCSVSEKPVTEKICDGACPPRWHIGEWAPCDGPCTTGVQRRDVRCMDHAGRYAHSCAGEVPAAKRECNCPAHSKTDYSSRESSQAQDEPSLDSSCTDLFRNCVLVVQARLCQYQYYKASCCNSCRKHHHDPNE